MGNPLINSLASLLLLSLFFGSIQVWRHVVQRWQSGLPALFPEPRNTSQWSMLTSVPTVGLVVVFGLLSFIPNPEPGVPSLETIQFSCLLNVLLFVVLMALLSRLGTQNVAPMGVRLAGWKSEVEIGFWAFLASLAPISAMLILMLPFRTEETQHSFLKLLQGTDGLEVAFWIFLAAAVLAPLVEELMFRVVLQGWLETKIAPNYAIGLPAVFFCAIHGWPDSIPLLPLALILGYTFQRTHSYIAVISTHFFFNFSNLLLVMMAKIS